MKQMKKWYIGLLAVVLTVSLVACGGKTEEKETEATTDQTTTSAVVSETEPAVTVANISMEDLKNYTIIRPEDCSEEIVQAGIALRQTVKSSLDIELALKSDLHSETVPALRIGEFEILLGNCDRDETRAFMADLKKNDFGYAMIGKKLVICGGSDDATEKALDRFINDIVNKQNGALFFDGTVSCFVEGEYEIDTFTLQGTDINEYSIVYKNKNEKSEALAQMISDRIAESCGYILPVKSDKESSSGKEILVGTTNRTDCSYTSKALEDGKYLIGVEGNYICARGADGIGDYYAVYSLLAALLDNAASAHQVTLTAEKIETVPMDESLKAMSFNVWVSSPTSERKESVRQTIFAYMPDTIGVQEASPTWMNYLNNTFEDIYAYVGLGRDGGGNGEHSAIFYRKDRFDLVETGTKWMSPTPDVVSKFKESSLNRVFTYAILLEKKTNTKIMVVNTHLEHTSAEARNLQVTVLMDFLKEYTQYPIVLTGDFNANPQSEVYRIVTSQLADSAKVAQKSEEHFTFHNYGKSSTFIDYAFVSSKNIAVSEYRVITEEMNGMLPSDHYALVIEYQVLD